MEIQKNIPLAQYTTLHIGGNAEYFVSVHSEEELLEAVAYAKKNALQITVLGGGSNVLIADEGIKGLVVHNNIVYCNERITDTCVVIEAGAGMEWDALVSYAVSRGYWGIENLSHIPGSVGATPIQNVGAYGVEVADVIAQVRVYDTEKEVFITMQNEECHFEYRHSLFKTEEGKKYIVTGVSYRLSQQSYPVLMYKDLQERFKDTTEPSLRDIREAIIAIRSKKFPDWHTTGTAGSFFKNPIISAEQYQILQKDIPDIPGHVLESKDVKIPLGYILDKVCHLKGVTHGHVGTYDQQALVLVAHAGATAREVTMFAQYVAHEVYTKTHITIEWEVTLIS